MKRLALLVFLVACGGGKPKTEPTGNTTPPAGGDTACVKTGCSGTVCAAAESDVMTTCEMKPEYQCYEDKECKVQADGKCGWTMTDGLKDCLADPPPLP